MATAAFKPRIVQMGDEQVKITGEDYDVDHNKDKIGHGSFGDVKLGRTTNGRQVAVKITAQDKIKPALNEIDFLIKLSGEEHIVKLIGFKHHRDTTGRSPDYLTFAMELAEGSLDKLMREGANIRGLEQNVLTDLTMDCCSAMKSLRKSNVAHRDIKHLNILVFRCKQRSRKSTYLFKFCDLGNASNMTDDTGMNSLVGTPNVLHPKLSKELCKGAFKKWKLDEKYTGDECDLWSLACTLFFSANGHYPFPHNQQSHKVYHNAVQGCLPDFISATILQGTNPLEYKYAKEIDGPRYPRWFRKAFSTLIRHLLHQPSLESYERIAKALVESKEYTFLSLTQLDVVKYADMSREPLLSEGHPCLRQVLELEPETECHLLGDDDETLLLTNDLSRLNAKTAYLILPKKNRIDIKPKMWKETAQSERFENLILKEEFFEKRAAFIGEGFTALHDADKMYTLFDTGRAILQQHLKKLRIKLAAAKESVAYPLRFAVYGNCQCQAWLVQSQEDQKIALEGMSKSESATRELTAASNELDKLVKDLDIMLTWLDGLQLDERELPGMEAELIRYAFCDCLNTDNYPKDVENSAVYTRELVQQCFDRRKAIADQFCQNIRADMLNGMRRVVDISNKLENLKNTIQDSVLMIELPFQAMKRRVEVANNSENITPRDLRRSVAFHSGPSRVHSSAAEIKDLAKKLEELTNAVKK